MGGAKLVCSANLLIIPPEAEKGCPFVTPGFRALPILPQLGAEVPHFITPGYRVPTPSFFALLGQNALQSRA